MSDTPRTDAVWELFATDTTLEPDVEFSTLARQLERELNAANVEIEEKRKDVVWLATEKAKSENYVTELENRLRALWDKYDGDRKHYIDRIKRLEEAVEAYRTAYTPDGHVAPHDCFATGPKTGNPIEDLVACPGCWAERKAKEAKL